MTATCRQQKEALQKQLAEAQGQLDRYGEARAAHVQGLREEVAAVEKRHADELEQLSTEAASLRQQLRDAEAQRNSALKAQQDDLMQQMSAIEKQRDEARAQAQMLSRQLDRNTEELQAARSSLESSQVQVGRSGQQLEEASRAYAESIAIQENMRKDVSTSQQDADRYQAIMGAKHDAIVDHTRKEAGALRKFVADSDPSLSRGQLKKLLPQLDV